MSFIVYITVIFLFANIIQLGVPLEIKNSPPRNEFVDYNLTRLIELGSHGITLSKVGTARVFPAVFEHIFKIQFSHLTKLKWKLSPLPCRARDFRIYNRNPVVVLNKLESQRVKIGFHEFAPVETLSVMISLCEDINSNIAQLSEAVNEVYNFIDEEVENTNFTRSKRSLIPFVGKIMKDLFGTSTESDVNHLNNKFNALEFLISNHNNKTLLLEKQMIGLSEVIDKRSITVDKALTVLANHMTEIDNHIDLFTRYLNFSHIYDEQSVRFTYNLAEMTNQAISSLFNLTFVTNLYQTYENTLTKLQSGFLPMNLIPKQELINCFTRDRKVTKTKFRNCN